MKHSNGIYITKVINSNNNSSNNSNNKSKTIIKRSNKIMIILRNKIDIFIYEH
jgi:hypothetical protein